MVDAERGAGQRGAQAEPEPLRSGVPVREDVTGVVQLRRAVPFGREDGEVARHQPRQGAGDARAALVPVAGAVIGSGQVALGGEGAHAAVRPALAGDLRAGPAGGLQPHLADDGALVAHQPLVGDGAALAMAVGDDPVGDAPARGGAVGAGGAVRGSAQEAVRG